MKRAQVVHLIHRTVPSNVLPLFPLVVITVSGVGLALSEAALLVFLLPLTSVLVLLMVYIAII
jgi:tellurite resistance protein TehA-like permease